MGIAKPTLQAPVDMLTKPLDLLHGGKELAGERDGVCGNPFGLAGMGRWADSSRALSSCIVSTCSVTSGAPGRLPANQSVGGPARRPAARCCRGRWRRGGRSMTAAAPTAPLPAAHSRRPQAREKKRRKTDCTHHLARRGRDGPCRASILILARRSVLVLRRRGRRRLVFPLVLRRGRWGRRPRPVLALVFRRGVLVSLVAIWARRPVPVLLLVLPRRSPRPSARAAGPEEMAEEAAEEVCPCPCPWAAHPRSFSLPGGGGCRGPCPAASVAVAVLRRAHLLSSRFRPCRRRRRGGGQLIRRGGGADFGASTLTRIGCRALAPSGRFSTVLVSTFRPSREGWPGALLDLPTSPP